MEKLKIKAGNVEMEASLYDNKMAEDIAELLPIEGQARTWGNEIYFPVSISKGYQGKQEVVEVGELAFWEPGTAFCIFFGATPASRNEEPRPANPVNVFGKIDNIEEELEKLKNVRSGTNIKVEMA